MRLRVAMIICGAGGLLSCNDVTGPRTGPPPVLRSELFDARNGGAANFFFLPPLAPATSFPGTFDPDRSPIVEICALTESGQCGAVIARYTTEIGTRSERVRVDPTNELYIVQWHARQPDLSIGSTYRIRVLNGTAELGHADTKLLKNGSEAKTLPTGVAGVVIGATVPIKFRIETSTLGSPVTATVGAEGGTIAVTLGNESQLSLLIPPGALPGPLAITVTPKSPSARSLGSVGIDPGDILFLKPVTLIFMPGGPLAVGDAELATFAIGTSGAPATLFLPTVRGESPAQSFTATTPLLGSPSNFTAAQEQLSAFRTEWFSSGKEVRLATTGPFGFTAASEQAQVDLVLATVEAKIAALLASVSELETTDHYPEAIKVRLNAAALALEIGDDATADQALQQAADAACQRITTRVGIASGGLGADFTTLWTVLRPVLAWAAASDELGLEPADCPALAQLNAVMSTLIGQFVDLYTHAMERPTFVQNATALETELYRALEVRPWGDLLGLDAEFGVIKSEIQRPLAQRLRKAGYDWCRTDNDQNYLGVLFSAAREGRMAHPSIVSAPPSGPLTLDEDFGFDAAQLSDDIHNCGTVVVVRSVDTDGFKTIYGPVGGGPDPATAISEITIQARPHGTIELDSTLVALRCDNEAIGNDRIFVDFNGTRIRELIRIGVTAHFIRVNPRVFKVDSLASMGGVNLSEGGTFPLTIVRESDGCGGQYLQTGEGNTKVLATINVEYPKVLVEITPSSATLLPGDSRQFTATVTGTGQTAVTWTVTGGSSSIAGNTLTYTAGSTLGSFTVKARSVADTARVATAAIDINAGAITVAVNPQVAVVLPGGSRQFAAIVSGTANHSVTWTATGGTISSSGLYTAGTTLGSYLITAKSVADGVTIGTAPVTVATPPVVPYVYNGNYAEAKALVSIFYGGAYNLAEHRNGAPLALMEEFNLDVGGNAVTDPDANQRAMARGTSNIKTVLVTQPNGGLLGGSASGDTRGIASYELPGGVGGIGGSEGRGRVRFVIHFDVGETVRLHLIASGTSTELESCQALSVYVARISSFPGTVVFSRAEKNLTVDHQVGLTRGRYELVVDATSQANAGSGYDYFEPGGTCTSNFTLSFAVLPFSP